MKLASPLSPGEVALVGAGPGDADLLTMAAFRLIADCDVIVYDALVSDEILALANPAAELICAGKRGGRPSADQQDICQTMVQLAQQQKRVVRLKGGDPFVFGRGGEEMRALAAAGIRFRVIPGITSGIAAPALAGIPVTDRTTNASLAFLTGHEAHEESRIDWPALVAAFPVLVFYMGAKNLPQIARRLIGAGLAADVSIAIIHAAGTANESCITGSLRQAMDGELVAVSPAIVVVGEVVDGRIDWRSMNQEKA
ncbi:MAG: uroporphyrinogen-III C-methyltransferase [Zetaproteobacteria bacterium CG_4_9_14_3_um_filter_49_83]|nr:MAG: uroporphyrinogen-III C-methyltransferase [Zetaproteobacteria bacterium CG1_02_49_23]PIQ31360.1 MAG: uroporphyrinogen-III C-methyltransferase [Zetaproteobacteria bacterium CG17_big_fil_post_rev_8_21_14_2_50_50_13]PIV30896.1 MAG: uroporphyrinogen-III C-methyltransferase [Zetaproteobacteria bacterium CG02_land_8_20_14_3_00_50_9]PIY55390.1 MAG: uroporphyrinogen-III C-methyltransferase [Zetaproteobacteria bacterium CG_4_10_14_0_8_um_filter_49_80]PJA34963.1 MAG: uroporphyrinogen-III C-methylt